jgi:hypothetical protein
MTQTAVSLTAMTTKPTLGKPEERTILFTTTGQNVLNSWNLWHKSGPLFQQCSVGPFWHVSRFGNTLPTFNKKVCPGNLQQKDKNNLADLYGSTDHPLITAALTVWMTVPPLCCILQCSTHHLTALQHVILRGSTSAH